MSRFITAESYGMPSVKDVHKSADGSGLRVEDWAATWDEDSENESFGRGAFKAAIGPAMKIGVPVLFHHLKTEAPVGVVARLEERPGGLWASVILPKRACRDKGFRYLPRRRRWPAQLLQYWRPVVSQDSRRQRSTGVQMNP